MMSGSFNYLFALRVQISFGKEQLRTDSLQQNCLSLHVADLDYFLD